MDRLVELVSKFHFTRNGYRINTDLREENRVKDKSGRTWLKQGPYSNTVRKDHPIRAARAIHGYSLRLRVHQPPPGRQPNTSHGTP